MTITTLPAERRTGQVAGALVLKKRMVFSGARLFSWKTVIFQSVGRELHALHIQQQERAFMATTHGLNYTSSHVDPTVH